MSDNSLQDIAGRFLVIAGRFHKHCDETTTLGPVVASGAEVSPSVIHEHLRDCRAQERTRRAVIKFGRVLAEAMNGAGRDATPLMRYLVFLEQPIRNRTDPAEGPRLWCDALVAVKLIKTSPTPNAPGKKRATVNQRMAALLVEDPLRMDWSAGEWAEMLGVTAAAVKQTDTWKKPIRAGRALSQADRISRG